LALLQVVIVIDGEIYDPLVATSTEIDARAGRRGSDGGSA
jgi:hypothetical protein